MVGWNDFIALTEAGDFNKVTEILKNNTDQLNRMSGIALANVLDNFDNQKHSLVVLHLLKARLMSKQITDWDNIFNRTRAFLINCNGEQVRHSKDTLSELSHLLTDELVERNTPMVGIYPLLKAIETVQVKENTLTTLHADVCKLSLASKCFSPAIKLLNIDYVEISKDIGEDPKKILLFFYYGGMILASLKKYERSLYYFESCTTMPASAVSHIMLEAYKKFLLVSLLVHGDKTKDMISLPKYTSQIVEKYFKPLCKPYHELVTAYYSNNRSELDGVIGKNYDVFETDVNTGLVTQVAVSQTKSNIKRLTKTFVTLSLEDVAVRVGLNTPKEAEDKLVSMIQEGSIHARISQKDGMVQFDGNPQKFDSVKELAIIEEKVKYCMRSNEQVKKMEEDILLSTKYIKKSASSYGDLSNPDMFGMGGSLEFDDDISALGIEKTNGQPSSNRQVSSSEVNGSSNGTSSDKSKSKASFGAVSSSSIMNEH